MSRIIIRWRPPSHLTAEDAAAWARQEIGRMLEDDDAVGRAELTLLRGASERHPADNEWMVELHLSRGVDGYEFVDRPTCDEWLSDMRSLGLRPFVMLADGETLKPANSER
jgi:hypothetical protein